MKIADKVLSYAKGLEVAVTIRGEDLSATRFYDNHIHQNLKRQNHVVEIRVIKDKKVGSAQVNLLDDGSLHWGFKEAMENLVVASEDQDFPGLARPEPIQDVPTFYASTSSMKPRERAICVGTAISMARSRGLSASGSFSTVVKERAVANTAGVRAYSASTEAFFRIIVENRGLTGYADQLTRDVRTLDYEKIANEAIEKATMFPEEVDLSPGRYDAIFLEYAVSDLLRFLGYIAFHADAKQKGTSFMATKMGQKVMGDNVTIWDDGLDPRGFAESFDDEGVPKRKVVFIENGIARDVVYDRKRAAKENRSSTGHAVEINNKLYPMPQNMFIERGSSNPEEMIKSTKKGLLVTRFHYTHCPEPLRIVATGTTRDGTFLIRNGEIVVRVRDMRFTESLIDAFSRVEAISGTSRVTRDWWGTFTSVVPAMKIKDFAFTGSTAF